MQDKNSNITWAYNALGLPRYNYQPSNAAYNIEFMDDAHNTAGQLLKTIHIDRGEQTLLTDVLNLPFVTNDAKSARSLFAYDNLQRPTFVWARDNNSEPITKRQIMQYGDSMGIPTPERWNLKGKLCVHFDEAGKIEYEKFDFKNNNTAFYRQVISDDTLTAFQKFIVDWDTIDHHHLDEMKNQISTQYDALNRIQKMVYPKDLENRRKEMTPTYNKAGALFSLNVDGVIFVQEIAYNAKGQRILMAMGNKMMTRYSYDPQTFRLLRQRSEIYSYSNQTYSPHSGLQYDVQYTYDLEGTIKTINDASPASNSAQGAGGLLRVFTHDPLRRLLSATGRETSNVYAQPSWDLNIRPQDYTATNTYTRSYQYDKLGNIQKLKHLAAGHSNQDFARTYEYLAGTNRLNLFAVGSNSFAHEYDTCGNLIRENHTRHYEWTANDKLAVFKNQAGSSDPTIFTNYFYNAQGERVKKHTIKGSKIEVTIYTDGGLFETTYTKLIGGNIDTTRFYNTLKIMDDTSASLGTGDALIATIQIGKNVDDKTPLVKYNLSDHLGNSTVTLSESGLLINREEYYPFGETSFGGFAFKRYRYNGKEKDEESGLYEYGQRYYAPWLCRFVSVDPIAEDYPQLSSYNYAGNKPITSPDIEGLQGTEDEPMTSSESTSSKIDESGLINIDVHNVKKGETISGLAKEYGVSQDAIRRANPQTQQRSQEDQINIGENIVIPLDILPDSSFRQRDPEGLEYIPFDSDYQKNLELQTETPKPTPVDDTSFQDVLSDIWNSPFIRAHVPDFISIGGGFSSIAGIGSVSSIEFNWVMRGPEASLLPVLTTTVGVGGGYSVDATLNFGRANYLGPVSDINRGMLQTSIANNDFPTLWGSGGVSSIGKIGVTGSYTPTKVGYGIVGVEVNIGAGLPAGPLPVNAAGGVSNTFILLDFYNR